MATNKESDIEVQLVNKAFEKLKLNQGLRKTIPVEFRKQQLIKLRKGLEEMKEELCEAVQQDLGRGHFQTWMTELMSTGLSFDHVLDNIDKWVRPKRVQTPLLIQPASSWIQYEPLGVALVMSSWNYPVFTTISPLIDVIAAGNLALIKPSEISYHSSKVIKKLVEQYLDPDCYICIEGGVEVARTCTSTKFDLIIYTGSTEKGKLVAQAAAQNLTPCILELGGKSPAIVDEFADIEQASQKITFGKFTNCGQTCIAPDYILVHESHKDLLLENLKKHLYLFFEDGRNIIEMGKVINSFHQMRLCQLLKDHGGELVHGNGNAHQDGNLTPTLILNPSYQSALMKDEIFGPILPIITFKSIDEAIKIINNQEKALAIYYFGNKSGENSTKVKAYTSSGAFVTNECTVQVANPHLPFGGVGFSGYGRYHGFEGFKQCSNGKAIFLRDPLKRWPYNMIQPPFTTEKQLTIEQMLSFSQRIPKNIKRNLMYLALIGWFGQAVYRKKITEQHWHSLIDSGKDVLEFLRNTITK